MGKMFERWFLVRSTAILLASAAGAMVGVLLRDSFGFSETGALLMSACVGASIVDVLLSEGGEA